MDAEKPESWYSEEAATLGDRLAAAREAAGLSQNQLATRLGVRLKTLSGWENDSAEPRANRLQMLAGMLGVSIMWLLTGRGDGINAPEAADAALAEPLMPHQVAPQARAVSPAQRAVMSEIRGIRAQVVDLDARLGQLEKHLRQMMKEPV
jgi:HTH-type transcriptional regulator, cell division transcriptional repressor